MNCSISSTTTASFWAWNFYLYVSNEKGETDWKPKRKNFLHRRLETIHYKHSLFNVCVMGYPEEAPGATLRQTWVQSRHLPESPRSVLGAASTLSPPPTGPLLLLPHQPSTGKENEPKQRQPLWSHQDCSSSFPSQSHHPNGTQCPRSLMSPHTNGQGWATVWPLMARVFL